jgi:ArsR family transcriptional regulator
MELSFIFKALGDDIRLRIFGLLFKNELCVCDIESVLGISQVNVSRHLAKMKSSGVLTSKKKAQWVYYTVNRMLVVKHPELLEALDREIKNTTECKKDMKTLAKVKKSKKEADC